MRILRLIVAELNYHWVNTLMGVLGLAIAVGLLVSVRMTSQASERETRRVMRDMGFNLRIIPKSTDMDHFWANGFSDQTMPGETVKKLAAQRGVFVSFNHLTPTLEGRIELGGRMVWVTGIGETIVSAVDGRQPMGFRIKPGEIFMGWAVAQRMGVKRGGSVELGGKRFQVERVLAEGGTDEDVRVFLALKEAQSVLGQPGRINEIKAIDCLCLTADKDPLAMLRKVIETALPEARVLQLRTLADARAKQRQMAERYARLMVPMVFVVGLVWDGVLGWLNVRERRVEIGLWRAMGHGSGRIAGLFLGKAALTGLVGGLMGYALGTWVALRFGPGIFQVTAKGLVPEAGLWVRVALVAPAFAVLASLIPTMKAMGQDPAEALRAD